MQSWNKAPACDKIMTLTHSCTLLLPIHIWRSLILSSFMDGRSTHSSLLIQLYSSGCYKNLQRAVGEKCHITKVQVEKAIFILPTKKHRHLQKGLSKEQREKNK